MSTTLRRGTLPAAAVLLALALALAALAVRPRLAGAQTVTGDVILSASVAVDPDAGHLPASPPGRLDTGKQRDPRATHPGRPVFRDEPMPGVTVGWRTGITMAPAGR